MDGALVRDLTLNATCNVAPDHTGENDTEENDTGENDTAENDTEEE